MGNTPVPAGATFGPAVQEGAVPVPSGATFGPAIAAPQQPSGLTRLWQGAVSEVTGAGKAIASVLAPADDAKEEFVNALSGPGGLTAYRAAKKVTDSVEGVFKGKAEAYQNLKTDLVNAVTELHKGDWRSGVASGASAAADLEGLTGSADLGARARELSEGTKPGGDLATPVGKTIADVGMAAVAEGAGRIVGVSGGPKSEGAPEVAAGEEAATVTPKLRVVGQGTAKAVKAGISEGTAETVAPTGEDIQPQLHQGIRNFVNQAATDAGLDSIPDSVPVTDAPQKLADAFQTRSQSTFDKVEEITGVNPTTLKQQMAARADQITEAAASGDLEKAGKLEQFQKAAENQAAQAFNIAKAQGVDIEQARSDWNASLRGDELSAAVRGSKANTSTIKNPILDPNKLAPRLQKLAESQPGAKSPKLFQLGGEDNATGLVEHAENARDAVQAIKDFVPQSATGQKLFSKIVSANTAEKSNLLRGGQVGATTDWDGVVKDIGNLTPEQQAGLGDDLARMRQVAGRQALKQIAAKRIKQVAGIGAAVGVAEEGSRRLIHALSGRD